MRILIVNNRYPSANKPYVATWLKEIFKIVRAEFPNSGLLVNRGNSNNKIGQIKDLLRFYLTLLTSRHISNNDVLFLHHFNLYWFIIKKRINNQKLIIHWHGSEMKANSRFNRPNKWNKDKKLINCVHIAPSLYFKNLILKKIPSLKWVEVIPSGGVDVELFKRISTTHSANEVVIGFASKLTHSKGVQFLILLAHEKKNIEENIKKKIVLMAIDYGATNQTKNDLRSLPIELVPPMSKEYLPGFYSKLDVLIFPSHHESLGMVPLEAMSCGVPVLCPDDFAATEYCIPEVSGERYVPLNYKSFKENLVKIIAKRGIYNPRQIIEERYSQEFCKRRYAEVIVSTLD